MTQNDMLETSNDMLERSNDMLETSNDMLETSNDTVRSFHKSSVRKIRPAARLMKSTLTLILLSKFSCVKY